MRFHYRAVVLKVVDGDTLDLCVDLGFNVSITDRFRIYGINAPETYGVKKSSEEYQKGLIAKNWLRDLLEGNEVLVKTHQDRRGKYGRWLAEIYLDNFEQSSNIGEKMFKLGLVQRYN